MKKIVAVLLVMVAWAALAMAAASGQDGQSAKGITQGDFISGLKIADTSFVTIRGSSTGGLAVYDESRDRDYVSSITTNFSAKTLAVGAGDSTDVMSVAAYRYLKLLLKIAPVTAGANNQTVRLGLQFREVSTGVSDSNTTFVEYDYRASNQGGALSLVDSSQAGHLATGSATLPWSGEYVVQYALNRAAPANAVAAVAWSYPNGISIPLDSMFGRPARFRYLQIRIRNMNLNNVSVIVTAQLIGFAQ